MQPLLGPENDYRMTTAKRKLDEAIALIGEGRTIARIFDFLKNMI